MEWVCVGPSQAPNNTSSNVPDPLTTDLGRREAEALLQLPLVVQQRPTQLPVPRAMRGLPPWVEAHEVVVDVDDAEGEEGRRVLRGRGGGACWWG